MILAEIQGAFAAHHLLHEGDATAIAPTVHRALEGQHLSAGEAPT